MCDMCDRHELLGLSDTLKQFLRPGVRIMVKHAMDEHDSDEINIVDDNTKVHVVLSAGGRICWEDSNQTNVVRFPTK